MVAVAWAMAGCGVLMLGMLAVVVWEDRNALEVRHPMAEDIPDHWC